MNQPLATYCDVPNLAPTKKKGMKRTKLSSLNHGYKRTWPPQFQKLIMDAKTVGDIVKAYQKAGSCYGIHSDMPEEAFAKIQKALKCKEQV